MFFVLGKGLRKKKNFFSDGFFFGGRVFVFFVGLVWLLFLFLADLLPSYIAIYYKFFVFSVALATLLVSIFRKDVFFDVENKKIILTYGFFVPVFAREVAFSECHGLHVETIYKKPVYDSDTGGLSPAEAFETSNRSDAKVLKRFFFVGDRKVHILDRSHGKDDVKCAAEVDDLQVCLTNILSEY